MFVAFKFSKALGTAKKGDVRNIPISTARALKAHKLGTFKEPSDDGDCDTKETKE